MDVNGLGVIEDFYPKRVDMRYMQMPTAGKEVQ